MAKILVVDDSGLSRRAVRNILERAGHEVVDAQDGMAALEKYFLENPEVVLLDVTMSGLSGLEVLTQLRSMDSSARVVMLTADVQSSTRRMAETAGAVGFICKPVSDAAILEGVSAALAGGVQ